MSNEQVPASPSDAAHEIWAAAQLSPGEAIEEGAARVEALLPRFGAQPAAPAHASDCARHNAPAYPVGPCDCGADPGEAVVAEVAAALELVRARDIVEQVRVLQIGGHDSNMLTAFQSGYALACEEITTRLGVERQPAAPVAAEPAGLREALEDYLEAQDALDNREYGSVNAEPYETLMQRRNAARRDLDAAISPSQAHGKSEAVTETPERGERIWYFDPLGRIGNHKWTGGALDRLRLSDRRIFRTEADARSALAAPAAEAAAPVAAKAAFEAWAKPYSATADYWAASDARADSSYAAGLKAGWNFCERNDAAGIEKALTQYGNSAAQLRMLARATPAGSTGEGAEPASQQPISDDDFPECLCGNICCRICNPVAEAQPDAADAARYRWLTECKNVPWGVFLPDYGRIGCDAGIDDMIDAEIAAQAVAKGGE